MSQQADTEARQNVEIQYLGLTSDNKSKVILYNDKRSYFKKVSQLTLPGAFYSADVLLNDENTLQTVWFGTLEYLRMGELEDNDKVNHAAAKKAMSIKKMENKMLKINDKEFGELTLNQLRHNSYHYSRSEKAALIASIIATVGA